MRMRPVAIVTRPAAQAEPLCAALRARGVDALAFPLIDIAPVADPGPLDRALAALDSHALVIFVSPNAIGAALTRRPPGARWPAGLPIGVMGPGSIAALAAHGLAAPAVRIVRPADPDPNDPTALARHDSEGLLAALDAAGIGPAALAGRRVLIVRGNGGRELLSERLREAGVDVVVVEAYQRRLPQPDAATWKRLRDALAGPHVWLLTSSEATRNLVALRAQATAHDVPALTGGEAIASHPRIAAAAAQVGFTRLVLAGAGDAQLTEAALTWAHARTPGAADAIPAAVAPASAPSLLSRIGASTASHASNTSTASPMPRRVVWLAAGAIAAALAWQQWRIATLAAAQAATVQQAGEAAREVLRQAQASLTELQPRIVADEQRLAELRDKMDELDRLYHEYGASGFALAEIEQMLAAAAQQLQITGNAASTIAILQQADARAARADRQHFSGLRRAIAADIDRLKAAPRLDLSGAAIVLEQLGAQIDQLPMTASERPASPAPHAARAEAPAHGERAKADPPWWRAWAARVWDGVRDEADRLLQVRRMDQPVALLADAGQAHYAREALKLRLLAARVSLLSRNAAALRADLAAARALLDAYFDTGAARVQAVRAGIAQTEALAPSVTLPSLGSLAEAQRLRSR